MNGHETPPAAASNQQLRAARDLRHVHLEHFENLVAFV
jgi:hypothetical protein